MPMVIITITSCHIYTALGQVSLPVRWVHFQEATVGYLANNF